KAFKLMAGVAALFQGIMQAAHDFNRLNVDGVLFFKLVLLVAGNEGEVVDVLVKIGQREFGGVNEAIIQQGQGALVIRLKVMQGDAGEIRDDYIARNFIFAAFAREVMDVTKCLRLGPAKVFSKTLVLDEQDARPEEVNVTILAGKIFYRLFKAGDNATANSEHVEEFIPVSLLFSLFFFRARPFL